MERDNYKNYNILLDEDDNAFIGFKNDLIKFYKSIAIDYIRLDIDSEITIDILNLIKELKNNNNGLYVVYQLEETKKRYIINKLKEQ